MKRSPLRRVSAKQAKELRLWSEVKNWRKEALILKYGWLVCEYCHSPINWFNPAEGHHNDHNRRNNTFENCRIVHHLCNILIEDRNVKDVPSLLED